MRHVSTKRARLNRQVKPLRDEYRTEFPRCQMLTCDRAAKELHEIVRGNGVRSKAITARAAWLHLCRDCHRELGDYSVWPIIRQMALKALVDPLGFDRQAINVLRGWQPDAITETEVNTAIDELAKEFAKQLAKRTSVAKLDIVRL